jgi:hypothetical protein
VTSACIPCSSQRINLVLVQKRFQHQTTKHSSDRTWTWLMLSQSMDSHSMSASNRERRIQCGPVSRSHFLYCSWLSLNRQSIFPKHGKYWSPLSGEPIKGTMHQVILHGQMVFLDGAFVTPPSGKEVSLAIVSHAIEKLAAVNLIAGLSADQLSSSPMTVHPTPTDTPIGFSATPIDLPRAQQTLAPFIPHPAFHCRHILSVKQLTQCDIYDLFSLAHEMRL